MANGVGSRGRVLPGSDRGFPGGGGILLPGRDFSSISPYTIGADGSVVPIGGGAAGGGGGIEPPELSSTLHVGEPFTHTPTAGVTRVEYEYVAPDDAKLLTVVQLVTENFTTIRFNGNGADDAGPSASGGWGVPRADSWNNPVDGTIEIALAFDTDRVTLIPITFLSTVAVSRTDTDGDDNIGPVSRSTALSRTLTPPFPGGYLSFVARAGCRTRPPPDFSTLRSGSRVLEHSELSSFGLYVSYEVMVGRCSVNEITGWTFPTECCRIATDAQTGAGWKTVAYTAR